MLDRDFINRKRDLLSTYVTELGQIVTKNSIKQLKDDSLKYHTIERLFQLTVDTMIDINVHILREGNLGTVDDLESTFKLLGKSGVIDSVFADRIAPIVGARNMIVHRYDKLDMNLFLNNLKNNFEDFMTYSIQIDSYIKKNIK